MAEVGKVISGIKFVRKLGIGGFSEVWLGINEVTQLELAIKVIPKIFLENPQHMTLFNRELAIMKRTEHPLLITMFQMFQTSDFYYITMEYLPNGSLLDMIESSTFIVDSTARRIFMELVIAVQYLHHDLRIVHRDLKVGNVMMDKKGHIRLIDFGFSNQFDDDSTTLTTKCGTPAFTAPEIILGRPYKKSVDIWSLGIILYFMLSGKLPFQSDSVNETYQLIVNTEPDYSVIADADAADLIKRMLDKASQSRICINGIIDHPYFMKCAYTNFKNGLSKFQVIDRTILHRMTNEYGLDIDRVPDLVSSGDFTPEVAIYRQLKLAVLTSKLDDLFNGREANQMISRRSMSDLHKHVCDPRPIIREKPIPACEPRNRLNASLSSPKMMIAARKRSSLRANNGFKIANIGNIK